MSDPVGRRSIALVALSFAALGARDARPAETHAPSRHATHAVEALEEKVAKLGTTLPEDRVYYRWQSTTSGENLVRLGRMNETLNSHFMNVKSGISAGPGLYMAEGPSSSTDYLPKEGGNLVEVRVARGTRVIDLTDVKTLDEMNRLGVALGDLYEGRGMSRGAMLKYDGDWLVGKNLVDKATFGIYPNPAVTHAEVRDAFDAIRESAARLQLMKQVRAHSPAIMTKILDDPHSLDMALHVAPVDRAVDLVRRRFAHPVPSLEAYGVWLDIGARPDVMAAIARDERLRPRLIEDARAMLSKYVKQPSLPNDPAATPLFERLLEENLPDDERIAVRKVLIDLHMSNYDLRRDPASMARKVTPLLEHVKLDAEGKAAFRLYFDDVLEALQKDVKRCEGCLELLDHAGLADETLRQNVARLNERRRLIDQAAADPTPQNVTAAIRQAKTLDEIHANVTAMHAVMPSEAVAHGVRAFGEYDAPEYARLLQTATSLRPGVDLAELVDSDAFRDAAYRAALAGNSGVRENYFVSCATNRSCRDKLVARITADKGRLFEGMTHLYASVDEVSGLRLLDPKFHDAMLSAMVKYVRSPSGLASIAVELDPALISPRLRASIIDEARARGLPNFRTSALTLLQTFAPGNASVRREFTRAAIEAAVHPRELLQPGRIMASDRADNAALSTTLHRRLAELGAREDDLSDMRKLKLIGALPRPRADAIADCLNALTRSVRP